MNPLNALQGVFQSPTLHVAAWGFVSPSLLCDLQFITKCWPELLTMNSSRYSKLYSARHAHGSDVIHSLSDTSKAQSFLGYKLTHRIVDGIQSATR
mgnify:CR=1 FL=1